MAEMNAGLDSLIAAVVARWSGAGVRREEPPSEAELRAFETKEELRLPADFQAFLVTAHGMTEDPLASKDSEGFNFRSLKRLLPLDREAQLHDPGIIEVNAMSRDFYVFCDYLDWSWAYAIRLRGEPHGEVVSIGMLAPKQVARSFTQFLEAYLNESPALYPD